MNVRNSCYLFCICGILNDHITNQLIFFSVNTKLLVVTLLNSECEMFGVEALSNWVKVIMCVKVNNN